MGITGAIVGGIAGFCFGGPLGTLFGSILGSGVQDEMAKSSRKAASRGNNNATTVFCMTAAAMLAKLAKADGRITRDEIEMVEVAFRRLGFSQPMRTLAVKTFRQAKDDRHSIYEYAEDFANVVSQDEMRVFFYELLWDIACADGHVSSDELTILRNITLALRIPPGYFQLFADERLRSGYGDRSSGGGSGERTATDRLADAYRQLGVEPSAADDEVKKAYRRMAKKYHPDALRAQGLPEEMIGKATERMSKINAAWSEIKAARGL